MLYITKFRNQCFFFFFRNLKKISKRKTTKNFNQKKRTNIYQKIPNADGKEKSNKNK